jgi:hypothetical protein
MAKLVLKYDERVLGEYPFDAEVTSGRLQICLANTAADVRQTAVPTA